MLWLLKPSVPLSSYRRSGSRGASTLHFSQFTYDAFILPLPLTAASPSPVAIAPPLRDYCIYWAQFIDGAMRSKKESRSGLSKMPVLDVCGFWISKINLIISWIYSAMETQFSQSSSTRLIYQFFGLSLLTFSPAHLHEAMRSLFTNILSEANSSTHVWYLQQQTSAGARPCVNFLFLVYKLWGVCALSFCSRNLSRISAGLLARR